jgi:hypothetical protein
MSREQLTEQETQGASSTETSTEQTSGLPPALHAQVLRLRPGDVRGLRDLLTLYTNFSQEILAVASSHVGLTTVQKAIALTEQNAVGRPPAMDPKEFGPGGEFELEGGAPKPAVGRPPNIDPKEFGPGGEFELEGSDPNLLKGNKPAVGRPPNIDPKEFGPGGEFELEGSDPNLLKGNKPAVGRPPNIDPKEFGPGGEFELEGSDPQLLKGKAEPPWVAGSRRYNAAHASFVSDFNEATGNSCVVDGELDPQAVARWQAQHGLAPDGKVGPMTVAAARKVTASAGSAGIDARPPV